MALLTITGFSLVIVWPMFVDQHWGLLDDGVTLAMARELQHGWHITPSETGRYFPAYFIYYALQYRFFGTQVGSYYVVQGLVLVLTNWLLYAIVHRLTGSMGLGFLAVLVFLTSSTIPENYYTLSKQEPRLLLFLLSSLYCYLRANLAAPLSASFTTTRRLPWLKSLVWGALSVVSLMIAYFTKETAFMMLPASCLWLLAACWLEKGETGRARTRAALGYLGANLLTFLIFVFVAYVYSRTPLPWAGSYTGLGLALIPLPAQLLYYIKVSFDVLLLLGLALVGVLCWLLLRPSLISPIVSYAVFCLLCAGGFLSLFIFVWRVPLAYYLLPTAAWTSIALSLLMKLLVLDRPSSLLRSSMMFVWVLILVLARTYSIPTFYNSAVALKAWHKVNEQMLMWVAALSENRHLLFFNFSNDHEYIFEVQLLLGLLYDRADIVIDGISKAEDLRRQARSGDLLLINFGGEANRYVWVRGVQAVPPLGYSRRSVASETSGVHLEEVFRTEYKKKILPPFSARPRSLVLGWAGYRVATYPE